MEKVKKITKAGGLILAAIIMGLLLATTSGFISIAAESEGEADFTSENTEVEVLEAKVLEDFNWSQGISPYTMLADCKIVVSGDSAGMHIDITTGVVGTASVLGIKDVKIWKKGWFGIWSVVATCGGAESYDRSSMGITILYANAVKDATYKITCVHYGNTDVYIEYENDSGAFKYSFYSD